MAQKYLVDLIPFSMKWGGAIKFKQCEYSKFTSYWKNKPKFTLEIILKERPLRRKEVSSSVICSAVFHERFLWCFGLVYIWVMATGEE